MELYENSMTKNTSSDQKEQCSHLLKLLQRWSAPLAALTILFGGMAWLTTLYHLTSDNLTKVQALRTDIVALTTMMTETGTRLGHVEQRLGQLESNLLQVINRQVQYADRFTQFDGRLGRIETKLDLIISSFQRR